tara:strand:+ start:87 stop:269 length:183 start_codon:yes stop_codon:yes gene_type:complete
MWVLFVYKDKDKNDLIKVMNCNTVKEIGYLLDMKPSVVSNYYHKLIRERGLLKYCLLVNL